MHLRKWCDGVLKLLWGGYLALTSLYCLLAFLPYTYYALIKAPAYSWIPFFVGHHALLFWLVSVGAVFAFGSRRNKGAYFAAFGLVACAGMFLTFHPFLANLQSNRMAYWGGIAALWLIVVVVVLCGLRPDERVSEGAGGKTTQRTQNSHFSYVVGILLAAGIALTSRAGAHIRNYADTRTWQWQITDLYAAFWSVVSHVMVAIVLISVVNLIRSGAARSSQAKRWNRIFLSGLIFAALWLLFLRFLESALSFDGWPAQFYAASLGGALTLLGFSIFRPFLEGMSKTGEISSRRKILLRGVCAVFVLAALAVPTLLGGGDWNGLYQGAFTLLLWIVLTLCAFCLWPPRRTYELRTIAAVVILSVIAYKGLQMTQLFWAKPVGATEDEIQRGFANYAVRDVSLNLTNRLLGNGHSENCGELCRILREYTEVRDAKATRDLELVDRLTPASGERPNIFLFVIDSVRQDYVGAYNAQVTFTPNLDKFARDSVAVRNVFTPYAGTSLSEPAIWAGALLLHAHFLRPFSRVNSLEKLAKTDGYQMFISQDEILNEILSPSDALVKLDTDKKIWNQLEVCSTVGQLETALDERADKTRPIFSYSQPKNVHQFARNNLPIAKAANWPPQPGFNYRISFELHQADECLGGFFGWLKARGLYDNSVIIVTSDHGDATGELGRSSHSLIIYPEIMRVPLIVHLPKRMEGKFVHDDNRVSALIDITPSLYYLLGHRPIVANPLFGRPLFADTEEELRSYSRKDLLFASDVRAAYGILADNGRYFYATYDAPAQSYLYDLTRDPSGQHDILTEPLKKQYDERIIEYLHAIADFYGYKPGIGSLLASSR